MNIECNFKKGNFPKFGIEEEFQIIDPVTKDLVPGSQELLSSLGSSSYSDEIFLSSIELKTGICSTLRQAEQELRELRNKLKETAQQHGYSIAAAGVHPFADWKSQKINPKPRYFKQMVENQGLNQLEVVYGLHLHIGVDDADQAVKVFNSLRSVIPHLIALSANSPFWEKNVSSKSSRMYVLDMVPQYGFPKKFVSWADYYNNLVELSSKFKSIRGSSDVFWDLRIRPDLGTVEVRCMDAQQNVKMSMALVAFLFLFVQHGKDIDMPDELLEASRKNAIIHGLSASTPTPLADQLLQIIDEMDYLVKRHGAEEYISLLNELIAQRRSPADEQIVIVNEKKSLRSVVDSLVI